MILKVQLLTSFRDQTEATPCSPSSSPCQRAVAACRNILCWMQPVPGVLRPAWFSANFWGHVELLLPCLNRQIDFLILEQETSAQAQTKDAPFLKDLNTDFCSENHSTSGPWSLPWKMVFRNAAPEPDVYTTMLLLLLPGAVPALLTLHYSIKTRSGVQMKGCNLLLPVLALLGPS